ncbi:MAG: T9SS type A sorting domain-containing protein [Saprospiraceae bacterium]|jgi:hypothetical protein
MQLRNIITIGFFLFNSILANTQHAFTEHIKLHCDDSVIRSNLGYPTWNPATIFKKPHFGYAEIREDSSLRQTLYYRPPKYFHGFDTLMVLCAKATQITCDTGIYIIEVSCNAHIDSFISINLKCNEVDTFKISNSYEAEIAERHIHGQASLLIGVPEDNLLYQSESKFAGQDYVLLYLKQLQQYWLIIYNVTCNISSVQNNAEDSKWAQTIFVTNDILHLDFNNLDKSNQELLLFDLSGRYFSLEKELPSNELHLILDQLPAGYYFLVYKSNKQTIYQRFILLH